MDLAVTSGPFDAEAFLQVLLIADQHVHVLDNPLHHRQGLFVAAPDVPEFLAEIEVEGRDGAGGFGGFHGFDDQRAGGFGQRGENAAAMEPAHARAENLLPVEIAGLEQRAGFVAAVVKHHGGAHAVALVAVHRGVVRAAHAVVLEFLVKWLHAHRPHALGNQVANGIIHQRRRDAGVQAEAVRKIGGAIELAAADVDVALGRLAKRDDARIEAVDERAEGQEIQRAIFGNVQTFAHDVLGCVALLVAKFPTTFQNGRGPQSAKFSPPRPRPRIFRCLIASTRTKTIWLRPQPRRDFCPCMRRSFRDFKVPG